MNRRSKSHSAAKADPAPIEADSQPKMDPAVQSLREQVLTLKPKIDRLSQDVDQLRGWFQTLISGMAIAILFAIGISTWSVIRLLEQEQATRQEAAKAATARSETLDRIVQMEEKLQSISQQGPAEFQELATVLEESQQQLMELRDQISGQEEVGADEETNRPLENLLNQIGESRDPSPTPTAPVPSLTESLENLSEQESE